MRHFGWRLTRSLLRHEVRTINCGSPVKKNKLYTTTHDGNNGQPRTIFSGIQPTGIPHLGNYLGAIQPWVNLQSESRSDDKLIFSIVDLHSLTSRTQDVEGRRLSKRQTLAILLAAGLSPERCTIFHQSAVPQHAELHWVLSCDAGMGWLSRMPTWKDKLLAEMPNPNQREKNINVDISSLLQPSQNPQSQERLKLGLFSYPVLQAADILLYHATDVPVGADQLVHIEFARGVANSFNALYGGGGEFDPQTGMKQKGKEILIPPNPMISKAKRVMSLIEPSKKMSKSERKEAGRILVTDDEETIRKKIKGAVTDSLDQSEGVTYDPERRPGVSNLLEMIAHIKQAEGATLSPEDVAKEFNTNNSQGNVFRVLKERAAEVIIAHLKPIRERYFQLMSESNSKALSDIVEEGRSKAGAQAQQTLRAVHEAIGI